jgi:adenylate kinase
MKKQVILFGAPGAGKGSQAKYLVKEFGFKHISTGDILRAEVKKGTDLGKRIALLIDKGQLVDDNTILELLQVNLDVKSNSYIFDGYPRNIAQAETLCKEMLFESDVVAIYFDIDVKVLVERIVNRLVCPDCQAIYNRISHPPKTGTICDYCNCQLYQRHDDNEETVVNRMNVFHEVTSPVLDFFKERKKLNVIDASDDFDSIRLKIKNIIEESR